MLRVRLAGAARTIDVAQLHGITVSIEDEVRPLLDALREVDRSFGPAPSLGSPTLSSTLANDRGFRLGS